MRRREFIALVGGAAAWPLASRAQQARTQPHVGVLLPGTAGSFARRAKAFEEGLNELGYINGSTITIEWRWADDSIERLATLAAELVGLGVDVIVTGGTPAAKALKQATQTVPIIMAIVGDPVAAGLVETLARPGGNATGFSIVAPDLSGKRLELLKEILPAISSVVVMSNVGNPQSQFEFNEMQVAASSLGLKLTHTQISPENTIETGFQKVAREFAQALIVLTDPILYSQRRRMVALAAEHRIPAMYFFRDFVQEGGLVSYAPSDTDLYRRAARYVDSVLRGANPAELPIQQPTKFELVINLRTAKPPSLLARADEVIE